MRHEEMTLVGAIENVSGNLLQWQYFSPTIPLAMPLLALQLNGLIEENVPAG
jgi:hypothetical protein